MKHKIFYRLEEYWTFYEPRRPVNELLSSELARDCISQDSDRMVYIYSQEGTGTTHSDMLLKIEFRFLLYMATNTLNTKENHLNIKPVG